MPMCMCRCMDVHDVSAKEMGKEGERVTETENDLAAFQEV